MERTPWTTHAAADAAAQSLLQSGLSTRPLDLVRFGSNAMFRMAESDVLLRVAAPNAKRRDVDRTLQLAQELNESGIPVPQPLNLWGDSAICGPVNGSYVTAWHWVEADNQPVTAREFGFALRQLHAVSISVPLPQWDALSAIRQRAKELRLLAVPKWIKWRIYEELTQAASDAEDMPMSVLGTGPIHGDAHMGNSIHRGEGLVLLDLDDFCVGPREVDLGPTLVAARRLGLSAEDWHEFSDSYGFDLADQPQLAEPLCRIRQLTMTTWLMRQWGRSEKIDREIELRVRSLGERGEAYTTWAAR